MITESYEGLEAQVVTLNGGEITLTASDDGINSAGGADGSGMNGAGGCWVARRPGSGMELRVIIGIHQWRKCICECRR